MPFGDYNSFYLNYPLIQEHKKREVAKEKIMNLIQQRDTAGLRIFLTQLPWRVDYIVLPNEYSLDYPVVYTNEDYTCYSVGDKDGIS